MKFIRRFTNRLSYRHKVALLVLGGVLLGLGGLFLYLLRAHTYLGDDPAACVNCHIMSPYYATWSRSSHGRIDDKSNGATCNDCHVPHQNLAMKYGFKAMDGMKHVAYFVTHSERQAIMAEDASAIDFMLAKKDEGKACWDCHRNVPHGGMNSLSSTPNAESQVPLPPSPVPEWLQNMMK